MYKETIRKIAIVEEERVGKKYKVIRNYSDTNKLISVNPKLKIYEDRGIKFGNYFEMLFNY